MFLAALFQTFRNEAQLVSFGKLVINFRAQITSSHSPSGAAYAKRRYVWRRVSDLESEQPIRRPPFVWHSTRKKPPTTHTVFFFFRRWP